MPISQLDRYRGTLLGLATGDAVGTALEFKSPGTFAPLDDLVGGGPFNLEPGQFTDDTSMALCLATSLIERRSFDPVDQLQRYVRWYREGYLSSTGRCSKNDFVPAKTPATAHRPSIPLTLAGWPVRIHSMKCCIS